MISISSCPHCAHLLPLYLESKFLSETASHSQRQWKHPVLTIVSNCVKMTSKAFCSSTPGTEWPPQKLKHEGESFDRIAPHCYSTVQNIYSYLPKVPALCLVTDYLIPLRTPDTSCLPHSKMKTIAPRAFHGILSPNTLSLTTGFCCSHKRHDWSLGRDGGFREYSRSL